MLYLDAGEWRPGYTYLGFLKDKGLRKMADDLKLNYVRTQVSTPELAQEILKAFPKETPAAEQYILLQLLRPLPEQDLQEIDSLLAAHKLKREDFPIFDMETASTKKDTFEVAVMLPFLYDRQKPDRMRSFLRVYDLYDGIRMAAEDLNATGQPINLHAYDTKRDSAEVAKLLALPEMKSMDLLIGPLLTVTANMGSKFAMEQRITMVHPVSQNIANLGAENPFTYLVKPSYETMAKAAAQLMADSATIKKSTIIYGERGADSILAFAYKNAIEAQGFETLIRKVPAGEERNFIEMLTATDEDEDDPQLLIPGDSLGHFFVASNKDLLASGAITIVETRRDRLPLIGLATWLDYKFVSFEQVERLGVYFLAPDFVDFANDSVRNFKEDFLERNNRPASDFALRGYDAMLFLGHMLHKSGTYFQAQLQQEGLMESPLFQGYDYRPYKRDNQIVPIIRFNNAALEVVNPLPGQSTDQATGQQNE